MSKIHSTTDYSQFKFFSSNRNVRITPIVKSINEKNMLSSHPILVNKEKYVLDGQHRLKAAEFLKLPIYYIIDESLDEEDIPRNQVQRGWELADFLKFYSSYKEDYSFVDKLFTEYKYPLHFIVKCCSSLSEPHRAFREGRFTINKNKQKLLEDFKKFKEINDICLSIAGRKSITNSTNRAIWKIVTNPEYVHSQMIARCNRHQDHVIKACQLKDFMIAYDRFVYIHNFNSKLHVIKN